MAKDEEQVTFNPPLDIQPGQIQFVDACHPPLVAGDYRVDMRQSVKDAKDASGRWNAHPYDTALEFSVEAPRFQLQPSDIHSLYPPADQSGAFDNGLPQVVFTRRTLPWERTIDGCAPKFGKPFPPWMALLLLREDELRILDKNGNDTGKRRRIRPLPVLEPTDGSDGDCLIRPKDENVCAPELDPPKALYAKTRCLTLDLPQPLFKALAPRMADLPWLAHVRQIDTSAKEVYAHNDKGWFSVLVGNRLPQPPEDEADRPAEPHQAFLVSLEGWQGCLDKKWQPESDKRMRLVVLGNWSFECTRGLNFKSRMDRLNLPADDTADFPHEKLPDPWLRRPFEPFQDYPEVGGGEPAAADVVNAAYARGYNAYAHQIRDGEKTVSWYRGPLVPLQYAKPIQIQKPVRYSDALLRYDPNTGMLDTSYAAAWQLGRMLALQNQAFALALDRTRTRLRTEAERRLRKLDLEKETQCLRTGDSGSTETGDPDLDAALVTWLHDRFGNSSSNASPVGRSPDDSEGPDASDRLREARKSLDRHPSQLAEVSGWLGRLTLLYGVPLHYLLPDPDLIPRENLRLFFLDPNWVQALLQGAFSVGDTRYGDSLIDQAMNQWLQPSPVADPATGEPISNSVTTPTAQAASGERARLRQQHEGVSAALSAEPLHWPLNGFLLRSQLVSGWRGLEIEAVDAHKNKLEPLRIEQLNDELLMVLFNGVIHTLTIRQPREGLHFGLTPDTTDGHYVKSLRNTGTGELCGREIQVAKDKLLRDQDQLHKGVVRMAKLAQCMGTELLRAGQLSDGHFGSGAFALQLVEAAGEFNFCPEPAADT